MTKLCWFIIYVILAFCMGSCALGDNDGSVQFQGTLVTPYTDSQNMDGNNEGNQVQPFVTSPMTMSGNGDTTLEITEAPVVIVPITTIPYNLSTGGENDCVIKFAELSKADFQAMLNNSYAGLLKRTENEDFLPANREIIVYSPSISAVQIAFESANLQSLSRGPLLKSDLSFANIHVKIGSMNNEQWTTVRTILIMNACDVLKDLSDDETSKNKNDKQIRKFYPFELRSDVQDELDEIMKEINEIVKKIEKDSHDNNHEKLLEETEKLGDLTESLQDAVDAIAIELVHDVWKDFTEDEKNEIYETLFPDSLENYQDMRDKMKKILSGDLDKNNKEVMGLLLSENVWILHENFFSVERINQIKLGSMLSILTDAQNARTAQECANTALDSAYEGVRYAELAEGDNEQTARIGKTLAQDSVKEIAYFARGAERFARVAWNTAKNTQDTQNRLTEAGYTLSLQDTG